MMLTILIGIFIGVYAAGMIFVMVSGLIAAAIEGIKRLRQ
jgi:hypothetical protein